MRLRLTQCCSKFGNSHLSFSALINFRKENKLRMQYKFSFRIIYCKNFQLKGILNSIISCNSILYILKISYNNHCLTVYFVEGLPRLSPATQFF